MVRTDLKQANMVVYWSAPLNGFEELVQQCPRGSVLLEVIVAVGDPYVESMHHSTGTGRGRGGGEVGERWGRGRGGGGGEEGERWGGGEVAGYAFTKKGDVFIFYKVGTFCASLYIVHTYNYIRQFRRC